LDFNVVPDYIRYFELMKSDRKLMLISHDQHFQKVSYFSVIETMLQRVGGLAGMSSEKTLMVNTWHPAF
jgi:hypothetical protein